MVVRVKRIYGPAASDDGFRVLVDRIWPRGIKKADAAIDLWLKEVAPRRNDHFVNGLLSA